MSGIKAVPAVRDPATGKLRSPTFLEVIDRFHARVEKCEPDECWPWVGSKTSRGYGVLFVGRTRKTGAHRFAYELAKGFIPPKYEVRHYVCGNPSCCNPDHLYVGTHAQNMQDTILHGRSTRGARDSQAKLTDDQVRDMRQRWDAGSVTQTALAKEYKVSNAVICEIVRRKAWKDS